MLWSNPLLLWLYIPQFSLLRYDCEVIESTFKEILNCNNAWISQMSLRLCIYMWVAGIKHCAGVSWHSRRLLFVIKKTTNEWMNEKYKTIDLYISKIKLWFIHFIQIKLLYCFIYLYSWDSHSLLFCLCDMLFPADV